MPRSEFNAFFYASQYPVSCKAMVSTSKCRSSLEARQLVTRTRCWQMCTGADVDGCKDAGDLKLRVLKFIKAGNCFCMQEKVQSRECVCMYVGT